MSYRPPWKPIETAPKKPGEPILLCTAGQKPVVPAYWWEGSTQLGWVGWYRTEPPTHWMEMPEPALAGEVRDG